jgi:MoxR-like ATPase
MTNATVASITKVDSALSAILATRKYLNDHFPQREEQVDGVLWAILSSEHVVLLGPPGTAKTLVAETTAHIFGLRQYRTLLSRFTTPPEVFGPLSLKGLEADEVRFQTARMLPEAELAIIDEIFKAGTALLNTLLALINERTFYNGTLGPQPAPLRTVIGASNEMPQGEGLEALWDRFLLRFEVKYVKGKQAFRQVLDSEFSIPENVKVSKAVLDAAAAQAMALPIPDATYDALFECREALGVEGIVVSDRRWKKSLNVARAAAFLAGNTEVEPPDLLCLTHSLWREPKEKGKVAKVLSRLLDSDIHTMTEIVEAARETLKQYEASPKGVKESASFGKTLRAMKEKAEAFAKKASTKRQGAIQPLVKEVTDTWRQVIRLAAESAGLPLD